MGPTNVDLSLSGEQRQLVDSFAALYARESTSQRVRAAEPSGFDARLWKTLQENGVVHMAVDEAAGGWGASELELALIAEPFGRAVASAPVIEAQVAARLLAQCGQSGAEWLAKALAGDALVTFMPRPGKGLRLGLVPAAAVADAVVLLIDERLVIVPLGDDNRTPVENMASMPLADIDISDHDVVLVEGTEACRLFSDALDLWLSLTAMALVGAAQKAVELGVEYAKQRHAFGTAIGTFQAVSHSPTRRHAMRPAGVCTSTAATASGWNRTFSSTTGAPGAGRWCTESPPPPWTVWPTCVMGQSQSEVIV